MSEGVQTLEGKEATQWDLFRRNLSAWMSDQAGIDSKTRAAVHELVACTKDDLRPPTRYSDNGRPGYVWLEWRPYGKPEGSSRVVASVTNYCSIELFFVDPRGESMLPPDTEKCPGHPIAGLSPKTSAAILHALVKEFDSDPRYFR